MKRFRVTYQLDQDKERRRQQLAGELPSAAREVMIDAGARIGVLWHSEKMCLELIGPQIDLKIENVKSFHISEG